MTETKQTDRGDGNQTDGSAEEIKPIEQRQDAFVVFGNEKDLRHPEAIRIKASLYTGIALRVKVISPVSMENLLYAIDLDSGNAKKKKSKEDEEEKKKDDKSLLPLENNPTSKAGIVNLRLEECRLTRKAAAMLAEWLKHKSQVETIGLVRVTFDDIVDFKKLTEGMKMNQKLIKICFQHMNFDEEMHGTSIGRVLADSRSIRELDVSNIFFDYKCFYDMSQAILNERCRLNILKMRGLILGEIEGKILQFILMQNKQLHTLDLSQCRTDDPQNFDFFLSKFDQFCHIRYLTMENMQPDFSPNIETLGEALSDNKKLEVLVLRDNKIKWVPYQNFWTAILPNRTIQKVNLQKTDLSDRVVERIGKYLEQENILLTDVDLSKNQITDIGLKALSMSLMKNQSVKFLNLGQNKLREDFDDFVELLKINKIIMEVSFGGNTITNDGITTLAQFLPHNSTLRHLDLSRNQFNDSGFDVFAEILAQNNGLIFLDIAKNKEISDEGSLLVLCDALTQNKKLQTIDLTGLTIRKPFLKQNFDQALKRNITLQEVFGKIPPNIIQSELDINIVIEKDVLPLYSPRVRPGKNGFDLSLVEDDPENHSLLNLREQNSRLIKAAFKLIRNYDIRSVDFTEAGIQDDAMRILSSYLRTDPNLRSIILDKNSFSDEGLQKLTTELNKNTKLAHLSIKGCTNVTNVGLQRLCDVISTTNTCLFQVDLDIDQFEEELALTVIQESQLNRAIQEKLKPSKTITTVAPNGEVIKVTSCIDKVSKGSDSETESENDMDPLDEANASDVDSQNQTNATDTSVNKIRGRLNISKSRDMLLDQQDYKHFIEVKFSENAKVGECFDSALKAWRIYQPNVIHAENQSLNDEHIQKLCDFLADREMITHLNLRRNYISNAGAKCLGKFISEFDHTLTHLDLTRNLIGQDGGQALLDALNQTTRIVECQIKYGNPLSNKMSRIIERETHANIQAISYVSAASERGNKKYELMDKGPDFMRCAIKMAQIHNILHLSLPDNMLALEDSRMLSDLIKRNTVLRKLNLQQNKLDADCAALIANALVYNSNLQLLDVSQNVLGDLGVYLLLTPLIRKNLQAKSVVSKATPLLREKEIIQGKDIKASGRLFKTIPILTELRYLDLEQNLTSCEVFRQIWLAMTVDPNLIIQIENPSIMESRDNFRLFVSEQEKQEERLAAIPNMPTMLPLIGNKKIAPEMASEGDNSKTALIELQHQYTLSDGNKGSEASQNSIVFTEDLDTEGLQEQERINAEKERERILAEKKEKAFKRKLSRIMCCQRFCCFKDEEKQYNLQDRLPTLTQVMCWRFLKSRRTAVKFHMGNQTLEKLEASAFQVCVSMLISLNYILLYAVVIVPFVLLIMHDPDAECEAEGVGADCSEKEEQWRLEFNTNVLLINAGVLIYAMVCEIVIVMINLKPSNTKCNSYLVCQIFTGLTMKAVILISGQLIAVFFTQIDLLYFVLGVILASTLVLSQIRAFQIWLVSIRKDKNNLLPRINQNLKICMSTNYLAASTIYSKVCVEASIAAMDQSKALEAERLKMMSFSSFADEEGNNKKSSNKGKEVKAKLAKCKCCKWSSPKFYQVIMNDIPLLICVPVAFGFGLLDPLNAIIGVFLTLFDLIFMLFYLSYDEELSIDADSIFAIIEKRILDRAHEKERLLDDNYVTSVKSEERSQGEFEEQADGSERGENEQMLTEQNQIEGNNGMGDTVAFELGGQADVETAKQVAEPAGELIEREVSQGHLKGAEKQ